MVSPRQRASILQARAQAERSLKRDESLVAKARQTLRQQKPDIQKAIAAATADEHDIQAGTEGVLGSRRDGFFKLDHYRRLRLIDRARDYIRSLLNRFAFWPYY